MNGMTQQLREFGFFNVTGLVEAQKKVHIGQGKYRLSDIFVSIAPPDKRNCHDYTNGIYTVVDEYGNTWIMPAQAIKIIAEQKGFEGNYHRYVENFLASLNLSESAHVPFATDNGYFIHQIWPWAFEAKTLIA